jgi:hypothetical protein
MKVSEVQGYEKKLFRCVVGRGRRRYVGRDAALWKYPVDSRIILKKWKLLKFITSDVNIIIKNVS